MSIGFTVLNQVLMMFSLMLVGYILYIKKLLDETGTTQLSTILLQLCTPAIIINSFNIQFSLDVLSELGLSFGLAMISILIGLIIARIIYGKAHRIEQFAITFSNVAFFGIPLVSGLLGNEYVTYLSTFILAFNLLIWTIGLFLVTGDKSVMSLSKFFKTPAFIGMALGFILFVSPIKLSGFIQQSVASISAMNTPIAMLLLGTYLAKSKLVDIFKNKHVYTIAFLRLILIPLIVFGLLSLLPNLQAEIRLVILIATSAPTATTLAIFSQKYGDDYTYGAQIISFTNIMCLFTIPIIVTLAYSAWI